MLKELLADIKKIADPKRAAASQRYFKTGKGEYGEGDIFIGLNNPQMHMLMKKYKHLSLSEIQELLNSKIHEERFIGTDILAEQYIKGPDEDKKKFYEFYLKNAKKMNNWDLVDSSAPYISGPYLLNKPRDTLYKLVVSENLWERRIAIMSTFAFIKNKEYKDTFKIAEILLNDKHDLIHKAVGWMLREVGNKCGIEIEEQFLKKHYKKMPRTMLRYAIEKFPEELRQRYLKGNI